MNYLASLIWQQLVVLPNVGLQRYRMFRLWQHLNSLTSHFCIEFWCQTICREPGSFKHQLRITIIKNLNKQYRSLRACKLSSFGRIKTMCCPILFLSCVLFSGGVIFGKPDLIDWTHFVFWFVSSWLLFSFLEYCDNKVLLVMIHNIWTLHFFMKRNLSLWRALWFHWEML